MKGAYLISSLFLLFVSCADPVANRMIGIWDISGKPKTIFNKGLAYFDEDNYAWIDANVHRYRYDLVGGRPILMLDGNDAKVYHVVKVHPDTMLISDGTNGFGALFRSRGDLMQHTKRIAKREIETIKTRYGRGLGDQLVNGRDYINRRYQ